MNISQRQMIMNTAVALLRNSPDGLRYSELCAKVREKLPQVNANAIRGSVYKLEKTRGKEVAKPSRGLYKATNAPVSGGGVKVIEELGGKEKDFYEAFAEYIKLDLDECTEAFALGGSFVKTKWATPDVIGIYKPEPRDAIKFDREIVSAEIKLDPYQAITAFGQAVSYRLFSTQVYLVLPKTMPREESDRVEALCMLCGIGLVLYQPDPAKPEFTIRVRSQKNRPDMFYVNEFAKKLQDHDERR